MRFHLVLKLEPIFISLFIVSKKQSITDMLFIHNFHHSTHYPFCPFKTSFARGSIITLGDFSKRYTKGAISKINFGLLYTVLGVQN